jgi:polyhydroxyalkanoate synthesis regulator phasin
MLDTFRTLLLAGIGTIDLSGEKMRQLTADLVRRGELATEEARKLVALHAARSAEREGNDEGALAAAVADELARRNVASHAAVTVLDERVTALEQVIGTLLKAQGRA